ncbi:MAG: LysM peptidoglycan-binding domain-containing protein [Actinomycetes bacterium]
MSTITVSAGLFPAASAPRVRRARQSRPVHLTRRGRLLLTMVALLMLVGAGVLAVGGAPASAGSEPGAASVAERVTVRPGETLWAIAEREAPGVDPRETVAAIIGLNALDSSAVAAGSVLLIPPR